MRQIQNALHAAKVKPMITQCCMVALYNAEKEAQPEDKGRAKQTVALAKEWERRKCNHKDALAPGTCLEEVIGPANKHRYVLAADDPIVRRMRRRVVPGLPILHYTQSVLVLEPMSSLTERHIAHMESDKSAISPAERRLLEKAGEEEEGEKEEASEAPKPVKRKRAKEPNPLSKKKPKAREPPAAPAPPPSSESTAQQTSRRRKKRGRGAGHD